MRVNSLLLVICLGGIGLSCHKESNDTAITDASMLSDTQSSSTGDANLVDIGARDFNLANTLADGQPRDSYRDGINKAQQCAATFGNKLTDSFGRLDGTVWAIVTPFDTQCVLSNDDHLVLQVTMNGAVYRAVVNVMSTWEGVDPNVRFADVEGPALPGDSWSEGWHTNVALDYPSMLNVHSSQGFTPYPMNELLQQVTGRINIGDKVSVFGSSSGGSKADSMHLVHRNTAGEKIDGAIVLNPTSATPHYLLFHFANQSF